MLGRQTSGNILAQQVPTHRASPCQVAARIQVSVPRLSRWSGIRQVPPHLLVQVLLGSPRYVALESRSWQRRSWARIGCTGSPVSPIAARWQLNVATLMSS
eukprot:5326045-Pyramimonas_sp.AAC.1